MLGPQLRLGRVIVHDALPPASREDALMPEQPPAHLADQPMPDSGIGEVLMSSRGLAEYRAMFALTDADLAGSILDCPGGASSATAEICAGGGKAIACDPVYGRGLITDQLAQLTQAETDRGNTYVREHPDQYRWTFFTDPDDHHRSRSRAGQLFAHDYRDHPQRYVAGSLPHLPFPTASFDLALSSHLLFSYADRLSAAFHHQALTELVRVARTEARIFPLVAMGSNPYDVTDLLVALRGEGIIGDVVDVDYEFQAGGNQMLVCRRVSTL